MYLVFTDLDGTLLDHDTYSWEPARPAIDRLKRRRIPWMLVTSKTRSEVEYWRRMLGNEHPFIVENGGAAFIPEGYLPGPVSESRRRDAYDVLEWGMPYHQLVAGLKMASKSSKCRVRGFNDMTAVDVATVCQMPLDQAVLAKQREYDEPFVVLDLNRTGALEAAIAEQGLQWTRGGRFWHLLGNNDKARAVKAVSALFENAYGPVITIGLGDGLNDVPFLNLVNMPVLIRSKDSSQLKSAAPRGVLTYRPGPEGWNAALLNLISG